MRARIHTQPALGVFIGVCLGAAGGKGAKSSWATVCVCDLKLSELGSAVFPPHGAKRARASVCVREHIAREQRAKCLLDRRVRLLQSVAACACACVRVCLGVRTSERSCVVRRRRWVCVCVDRGCV